MEDLEIFISITKYLKDFNWELYNYYTYQLI